ncbi:zinc metallopeptidase [Haloferula sp. A504]|uniref:zinc metallopeptidase n=1 Tax=Haloferula sp. A504 TaxID=3373601 RepID=UPI0031BD6A7B|nr:zinc metallopeptidase [Verrucomicrobiaceae bacterium E54]
MIFEILAQYSQQPAGGQSMFSGGYLLLIFGTMAASMLASGILKAKFRKYSQVPTSMTGAQVAELMLRQNGITDVRVISTPGQLTDHYDPRNKTVNLSDVVYGQNSAAAAAVAAHECGHALQHQQAYAWLQFRSKMVPMVTLASRIQQWLLMLAIFGLFAFGSGSLILIYVFLATFVATTLFSIVTLPVEFDASKRALAWLDKSQAVRGMEHAQAKDALFWAAMTYVVAALAAIAQLAYWAMMLLGRRN